MKLFLFLIILSIFSVANCDEEKPADTVSMKTETITFVSTKSSTHKNEDLSVSYYVKKTMD